MKKPLIKVDIPESIEVSLSDLLLIANTLIGIISIIVSVMIAVLSKLL